MQLARHWISGDDAAPEVDPRHFEQATSIYPCLNALCEQFIREDPTYMRPAYLWGTLHGAHLAKSLGVPAISVLEFGVAGGNGLVALQKMAERVEGALDVNISVYGFDTGEGLPPPIVPTRFTNRPWVKKLDHGPSVRSCAL